MVSPELFKLHAGTSMEWIAGTSEDCIPWQSCGCMGGMDILDSVGKGLYFLRKAGEPPSFKSDLIEP